MNPPILSPILLQKNKHERDDNIEFFEEGHKYSIKTDPHNQYTSVTTWNHSHFPHFNADEIIRNMMKGRNWKPGNKYWNMTAEQIKQLWSSNASAMSGAGTELHYDIECFMNQDLVDEENNSISYTHEDLLSIYEDEIQSSNVSDEWNYFLKFLKDTPELKPYRTEWMIYHEELKLAGSIDMVYENPDGSLIIYDWKRSKEITKINSFNKSAITECIHHLPDANYWHYSLQLNTYKAILEQKYGKKITGLYLVRLHPNNEKKSYDLIKCADLSKEISELFNYRIQTI
jgi:hypothetical protein